MKRCVYCGNEQPDEATSCPIDGEPLKTVIATPSPPVPPVAPLTLGSIKTLLIGLVAFGLIIWPIILLKLVWAAERANVHYVAPQFGGPWAISWLVGFILAIGGIAGSFRRDAEGSVTPKLLGRFLCIITLCIQIGFFLYGLSLFSKLTSN